MTQEGRPRGGGRDTTRGSHTRKSRGGPPGARRRPKGEGRGPRATDLDLPADIDARDLSPVARRELRSLPSDLADLVARHLVVAERLLDDDAELAYRHTKEARRFAARLGVVREACGIAAYRAGRWADAVAELRAARRMTGSGAFLPIIADCERGLGRPERAIALARSRDAARLDPISKVEMMIVESGARRDLGQADAAVVTLQAAKPDPGQVRPWSARLFYAYADALLDAGRREEGREWFAHAVKADTADETDAAERVAELDGLVIVDAAEDEDDEDEEDDDSPATSRPPPPPRP